MTEPEDTTRQHGARPRSRMGPGIGIGVALGAAIGVATDNLALGIGIGVAMGVALGVGMDRAKGAADDGAVDEGEPSSTHDRPRDP